MGARSARFRSRQLPPVFYAKRGPILFCSVMTSLGHGVICRIRANLAKIGDDISHPWHVAASTKRFSKSSEFQQLYIYLQFKHAHNRTQWGYLWRSALPWRVRNLTDSMKQIVCPTEMVQERLPWKLSETVHSMKNDRTEKRAQASKALYVPQKHCVQTT